jgi:hypothetical protein
MWNDVYYRIIRIGEDDNILTVVCMQDHDEMDYDHSRFLCAKGTEERLYFSTEEKAIKFLNDNINLDNIDPKYLVQTQRYNDSFYKDE